MNALIETAEAPAAPVLLAAADRTRILFYLGMLIILLGFGAPFGGLIDIPVSFFLKNKLRLGPTQVAEFRLVAAIPLYLSFLFGFVRDTWSPFGLGDRGYFILFGALSAGAYCGFAFAPVSEGLLLAAVVMLTSTFLFVSSAQNGLTSAIGQRHVMSGQVSTAWNIFGSLPTLSAYFLGGVLSDLLEGHNAAQAARILFLVGAVFMIGVAALGTLRPRAVYDTLGPDVRGQSHLFGEIARLARHWPVYPALLIWLLWNFAPGSTTPLQYYLQNTLHARDADYGLWNAIFVAGFLPTFLAYGFLCRRFPLRTLLFWGTVVAVPQMVPLAFIHSVGGALVAAAAIGLMGGVCSAAYTDLLIRSCPRGMEGTTLMMSGSLYFVAQRFGDLLGTTLYARFGGFGVCVIAITAVYALILPVLKLIPPELVATADGETGPGGH